MLSHTRKALEEFDNPHDFERMCAEVLLLQGNTEVVPIAPRGGSDGGQDITFTTPGGGKGLACVTLRKGIEEKFKEDFSQRKEGEYSKYMLFCTASLTAAQKLKFSRYCLESLEAEFVPQDIEAMTALLDTIMIATRQKWLNIGPSPQVAADLCEITITYENVRITRERHDYRLLVTLLNRGVSRLPGFYLDVEFPTPILTNQNPSGLVPAKSNDLCSLLRVNNWDGHVSVLPGDQHVLLEVDYYVDTKIYSGHRLGRFNLSKGVVKATLNLDGFPPLVVEKSMKDLQIF